MIKEYYLDFEKTISYKYLTHKCVNEFGEYLTKNCIPLGEAYDNIFAFSESCNTSKKTQRVYRTRLRRFIEYIYEKEGIPMTNEGKMILRG